MKNTILKNKIFLAIFIMLIASPAWALAPAAPDKKWFMDDTTFWILIAVAAILFYVIYALAEVVMWSGKKKMDGKNKPSANLILLLIGAGTFFIPSEVMAQAANTTAAESTKDVRIKRRCIHAEVQVNHQIHFSLWCMFVPDNFLH